MSILKHIVLPVFSKIILNECSQHVLILFSSSFFVAVGCSLNIREMIVYVLRSGEVGSDSGKTSTD